MAITIGTADFSTLTAQPFGYDENDVRAGQSARKWTVTGLLKPSEWLDLLNVYDEWRDTRIDDEPTSVSGVIGTTIDFTGDGPGGQSWTSVACWFSTAPEAAQSGAYLSVTVELVDASQALQVILKQIEQGQEEADEDLPDLGTFSIGGTVVTLLKPVDSYASTPSMELTAGGSHYIQGPLVAYKTKDVEGTTDLSGWNNIRSWYENQVISVPTQGSYFPISAPSATAANKVIDGVTTIVYTVSIQLGYVL